MSVAVVVLAGGEGRRIGGGKPLKQLGSARLIDRAIERARSWSDIVAVSLRQPDQVDADADIVIDEPTVAGPLAALIAASSYAADRGCDLVLTIAADMPFLPDDLLDRLVAEIGSADAALAASGGVLHPVCALWRRDALRQAQRYADQGGRSLRGFAASVGFRTVDWQVEPYDPFFNVNRAEDLVEAERLLGR